MNELPAHDPQYPPGMDAEGTRSTRGPPTVTEPSSGGLGLSPIALDGNTITNSPAIGLSIRKVPGSSTYVITDNDLSNASNVLRDGGGHAGPAGQPLANSDLRTR